MIQKTTAPTFDQDVKYCGRPCVVKFYSRDCHLCNSLAPIFERMSKKYGHSLKFVRLDIHNDLDFVEPYLDGGIPTIQVFYKDYPPILVPYPEDPHPMSGYKKEELESFLYNYILSYKMFYGAKNEEMDKERL
jgi:thiol-disulfide isomerase/thioredoxin